MKDMHAHMIPPVYYEALEKHGALLEDGFPLPVWSADEHLKFMDEAGISWSLLSVSSPHPYFGDSKESRQLCREINLYGSQLKNKYPERFGFAATLPLPDIDVKAEFSKLYFDTAGNPLPDLLPLLERKAAPGHIFYGSDYPFTPKEQVLENLKALKEYKSSLSPEL